MAETLFLRDSAGVACGPGTRRNLDESQGASTKTLAPDPMGDTWNKVHGGLIYPGGTWSAELFLKKIGFTSASVKVEFIFLSGACISPRTIFTQTLSVTSTVFSRLTFSGSANQVIFLTDYLLQCIVTEISGVTEIQYDQGGIGVSKLILPDRTTVRPREHYKRQSRRRSC